MAEAAHLEKITAQPGFQTKCLSSKADITIIGGNAGGGKTTVMILDGVRRSKNPGHRGITFRSQFTQIKNPGGLWDASMKFYSKLQPMPETNKYHSFKFSSGAQETFSYLTSDYDVLGHQGSEYSVIRWDELTHFSRFVFFYMLSRLRSTSGIKPYVLASCNPEGEGWVKDLISWWLFPSDFEIEQFQDYPIPERNGKLRYFLVINDELWWGDSREEALESIPDKFKSQFTIEDVKSITFIEGKLSENVILNEIDPGYKGNLLALPPDEQEKLLKGRWRKSDKEGGIVKRFSFRILDFNEIPEGAMNNRVDVTVDSAYTAKTKNDPSGHLAFTEYLNDLYIFNWTESWKEFSDLCNFTVSYRDMYGSKNSITWVEPKASGKSIVQHLKRTSNLNIVEYQMPDGDKETRLWAVEPYIKSGRVILVKGSWNKPFLDQVCSFGSKSPPLHDEAVDNLVMAINQALVRKVFERKSSGRKMVRIGG